MDDYVLFKNLDNKYLTLEDFIKENKPEEAAEAAPEVVDSETEEPVTEEADKDDSE